VSAKINIIKRKLEDTIAGSRIAIETGLMTPRQI